MSLTKLAVLAGHASRLAAMDAEFRLESISTGCEPTCHFCDVTISIGDQFGFRKITDTGKFNGAGVYVSGNMKAMGCAGCVLNATPAQVAHAILGAEKRLTPGAQVIESLVPERNQHAGCFINEAGEIS